MNIEIFCLCKAVAISGLNQPTIIDIFDTKIAAGEPVLIDPFIVISSFRFYKAEVGIHRFQVTVKEASGKTLASRSEIVSITEIERESTTYFLQTHMGQVKLMFGSYEFSIESGGKQLARTPLYVARGNISRAS